MSTHPDEDILLTPNKPINRLQFVIKQYKNTPRRGIIVDVARIALLLTGRDSAVQEYEQRFGNHLKNRRPRYGRESEQGDQERREFNATLTVMNGFMQYTLPDNHPFDFVIPWVARELGRLDKAISNAAKQLTLPEDLEHPSTWAAWVQRARREDAPTPDDYYEAVDKLEQKATAIGQWATQENIDLNKTDLATALEAIKNFEVEVEEDEIPQGVVVMEFDDGYTVQHLSGEAQLTAEGEVMQHCVGSYCGEVERGEAFIYSLRDAQGRPHVTIEWRPDIRTSEWIRAVQSLGREARVLLKDPVGFLESELTSIGNFAQIRGKQNDMPAVKYREYVQEFINQHFGGDRLGLLMVALPGQKIDFGGYVIKGADFTEDWAWADVPFSQASFSGAAFEQCVIAEFAGEVFDDATFVDCRIADLFDVSFVGARFTGTKFAETFNDCDFENAQFLGCKIQDSLHRCSFEGARFDSCFFKMVADGGVLSDAVIENSELWTFVVSRIEVDGLTLSNNRYDYVDITNTDLSEMSVESAYQLWQAVGPQGLFGNEWPEDMLEEMEGDG